MRAPTKISGGGSGKTFWTPPDKEWLEHQYIVLKKSSGQIAKEIHGTSRSVLNWLERAGIPRRSPIEALRLRGRRK